MANIDRGKIEGDEDRLQTGGAHVTPLHELDDAWRVAPAGARLLAVRSAAVQAARAVASRAKRRTSVRTADLVTLPYPVRYGFGGAARAAAPYLMMTNRMQIVIVRRGRRAATHAGQPVGSRAQRGDAVLRAPRGARAGLRQAA